MRSLTCNACGATIEIDENREFGFCNYCGTKIQLHEVVEVKHTGTVEMRPASAEVQHADGMEEATKIKEYFESIANSYYRVDQLVRECRELENKSYKAFLISGIIVTVLGLIWLFSATVLGILCFFIVGPGLLALWYFKTKQLKELREQRNGEMTHLKNVIAHHYNEYKNCPIGFEYTHPNVLKEVYDFIRQGRAYNIKEAINMYEEQKYKNKMQQIALDTQRATMQMQQNQANYYNRK